METENELSEITKPHPRIGWRKGIGLGALILVLLVALRVYWNRSTMASKLQETLAELDRSEPGWRLEEIEAARANLPEEENSARVVIAAAERMPHPWPSKNFAEEHFHFLPPNEKLSAEDFVLLSTELAPAKAALAIADKLADMPRGRHHLHHERNPLATKFPHVWDCGHIAFLLFYESMRQNQRGESKKALTACRAVLNAARSLGDESISISQLVRSTNVILACQAIERTLAQGEPPPEDMSDLQKMLESEDAFPALLAVIRGERATVHKMLDAVERGEMSLNGFDIASRVGLDWAWLKRIVKPLWRMDTRGDHALYLSLMTQRIKELQRPMHEQAALEKQFEQERQTLPKSATLTQLLLPAASGMGTSNRCKHALLRSTIVALAAERYRRDKNTWPDNIDQLCPQYLAAVPLDPFDGKPLHYRRLEDGVVIYSVGKDAVNNRGKFDREHLASPDFDIGFRLWDVAQRRQPSKPKPPAPQLAPGVAPPPNG